MNEPEKKAEAPRARTAPRWLSEWLPEIVLVLVTTGAGIWAAGRWVDPGGDAGYAWSFAYRIGQGERLYRDIHTQYTPLSLYLLAAGAKVFGATARYFLFAYWIPAVLAAVLLLRCARPFLSTFERIALVFLLIAASLFARGVGHLVFPYYTGAVHALLVSVLALLLVRTDAASLTRRSLWVGCLAGIAFACKQEVGVAILVALGVSLVLTIDHPLRALSRLIGGFVSVVALVALFALSSASFESLVHDNRLWPLASPPAQVVYLFWGATGLRRSLWWAAVAKTGFRDLAVLGLLAAVVSLFSGRRKNSLSLRAVVLLAVGAFGWLIVRQKPVPPVPSLSFSALLAFVVAIAAILSRDLPYRAFLAGLATFAGLVGLRTLFSPSLENHYGGSTHFVSALTFLVALLVLAPRWILGRTHSAALLRNILAVVLFCIFTRQAFLSIRALRYPKNVPVETRAGKVFVSPARRDLLETVGRGSRPGERVLILPESNAIDALYRLREVSPLPWATPGWFDERIETRLVRRLQESPPDLVILLAREFKEYRSEPFGVGYGLVLSEWCSRNYRAVASLPAGQVLRRR